MAASGGGADRRRRWWLAAAAASALVHAALLAALLTRTGARPPAPAPAIEVSLLRPDLTRREPAPETQRPAAQSAPPDQRPPAISERAAAAAEPLARAPVAAAATQAGPQAPTPPAPLPSGSAPRVGDPMAAVRSALNAGGCLGDRSRLTAAQREACDARLANGREGPPLPLSGAHARELRGLAARRQGPRSKFDALSKSPTCIAGGPCQAELSGGIAFGEPPPALPVIPPSTLRGDDDALRKKPRP